MSRVDSERLLPSREISVQLPSALHGETHLALNELVSIGTADVLHFERFGVSPEVVRRVMNVALSRGGDYCDLFFEHKVSHYIGAEDSQVNRAFARVEIGVGIRVLNGDETGYSFTEDIAPEAMSRAALTAANIANASGPTMSVEFKMRAIPNYYPVQVSWEDVGADLKIPLLTSINEKVFSLDRRIINCSVQFNDAVRHILIFRSDGYMAMDCQPLTSAYVRCVAEQSGHREQHFFGLSGRYGLEYFDRSVIDRLAQEAVRRTVLMFDAVQPAGGQMEVVLAPGSSGILLHEAIGHGMEADFTRKNISIFSNRIGQRVAKSIVSIVDEGSSLHQRGSINIDDEGNSVTEALLVDGGVLRSYLHDALSAKYFGVVPTGNGRRESFRFPPIPRMRNTYMRAGPHDPEEIIGTVKKGLYAEEFTNGEVNIGAGDFSFWLKHGYLIENGKLTRPVKDLNIIGNGPDVLSCITMVGHDLQLSESAGTCAKFGQGVPVQMGMPTVKVSRMTVAGSTC